MHELVLDGVAIGTIFFGIGSRSLASSLALDRGQCMQTEVVFGLRPPSSSPAVES